jgi:hypothetical protein
MTAGRTKLPPSERIQHGSCVLTRLVSRAVCRVTAVGRLAETAWTARSGPVTCIKNPAERL